MYFSCVYFFKTYLPPLECKVHEGRDFYMFGSLPSLLEQCLSCVSVQYLGAFAYLNTYSFIYLAACRIFTVAWGTLVLLPGIEPMLSALEGGFLTTLDHQGSLLFLSPASPSCGIWTLGCRVLAVSCGILFPDQKWNLGPLHWECRVLATGLPGKFPSVFVGWVNGFFRRAWGMLTGKRKSVRWEKARGAYRYLGGDGILFSLWGMGSPWKSEEKENF